MTRPCLFLLLIVQSFAAGKSTFALWTRSSIEEHEATLRMSVAPDHSSRETLADYGDHRFRLLYRDADGVPEEHLEGPGYRLRGVLALQLQPYFTIILNP